MKFQDLIFYPIYLLTLSAEVVYDIEEEWDNIVARAKRRMWKDM